MQDRAGGLAPLARSKVRLSPQIANQFFKNQTHLLGRVHRLRRRCGLGLAALGAGLAALAGGWQLLLVCGAEQRQVESWVSWYDSTAAPQECCPASKYTCPLPPPPCTHLPQRWAPCAAAPTAQSTRSGRWAGRAAAQPRRPASKHNGRSNHEQSNGAAVLRCSAGALRWQGLRAHT